MRDEVLEVRMRRAPDNILTEEMCSAMAELLESPPVDSKILLLIGEGESFCRGRDRPQDAAAATRMVDALVRLDIALIETDLVTVCRVHGDALGFGASLTALSDLAIAGRSARFAFPEVRGGLAPSLVLAWLVPLVGRSAAVRLTASGSMIDADAAVRSRLVHEVVEDDELDGRVSAAVAELSLADRTVLTRITRSARDFDATDLRPALLEAGRRLLRDSVV